MTEQAQEAPRKTVTMDMPDVELTCPYCGDEDLHGGQIFEPGGDYLIATAETYCDKCEHWFSVCVK